MASLSNPEVISPQNANGSTPCQCSWGCGLVGVATPAQPPDHGGQLQGRSLQVLPRSPRPHSRERGRSRLLPAAQVISKAEAGSCQRAPLRRASASAFFRF